MPQLFAAQASVDSPLTDRRGFRIELVRNLLAQLVKECITRPPIVLPSTATRGAQQQGVTATLAAPPIGPGFGFCRRPDGAYWKVKPAALVGPVGPYQTRAQSSWTPSKFLLALCKALSSGVSSNVSSIGEEHQDECVRTFHSDLFAVLLNVAKLGTASIDFYLYAHIATLSR